MQEVTPTIPQPPFDLPPATRDETAPRSLPIRSKPVQPSRGIGPRGEWTEAREIANAQNGSLSQYRMGRDADTNNIPLDLLFR